MKVHPNIVKLMVQHYGSLGNARQAYRAARSTRKEHQVLFVETSGRITTAGASEVLYKGSPDAFFVLPLIPEKK